MVGESVLLLKPTEPYHIRLPIRRGQLNVHEGVGGSLSSVISDLESIWSYAIRELLHIPLVDLANYRAVLVIPDVYTRNHVKELIGLLLRNLGFASCFIQHEAVCASFGAGLSVATVVDVGDQKTSICCVEDGFSPRCTRITLELGGSDITQLFHYLLKQRGFPYSELKSESRIGGLLLQNLKHEFCHLDPAISGTRLKQFHVSIPEQPQLQYSVLISDECIHAPLALFHPKLFCITGTNKRIRVLNRNDGDSEDPLDDSYLMQTKRKYGESNLEPSTENTASAAGEDVDDSEGAENAVTTINEKKMSSERLIGIDQAIVQCIDRCDNEEVKKRMSCILLVGGGMNFLNAHTWIKYRLSKLLPKDQSIDVITRPKDIDGSLVTWKGAAVMSLLDTASKLWFERHEWDKLSVRLLREKAAFVW